MRKKSKSGLSGFLNVLLVQTLICAILLIGVMFIISTKPEIHESLKESFSNTNFSAPIEAIVNIFDGKKSKKMPSTDLLNPDDFIEKTCFAPALE